MPPVAIAAGIAAGGSILGGAIASKGASNAAKAQQQVANQQIANNNANRDYVTGLYQPTIDRGNAAGNLIGQFLGTEGGDQAASALATYRGSTGYQDLLNTGLGSVNSNAYARGLGASGATLKALQAKGMSLADQSSGQWLNGLNNLYQTGSGAIGNIAGAATNTTINNNAALGNAADASSNASLSQGAIWNRALQNLANAGSSFAGGNGAAALGSSYTPANNNTPVVNQLAGNGGVPIGGTLPNGFINFGGWRR